LGILAATATRLSCWGVSTADAAITHKRCATITTANHEKIRVRVLGDRQASACAQCDRGQQERAF
jgi:hypothetical protein